MKRISFSLFFIFLLWSVKVSAQEIRFKKPVSPKTDTTQKRFIVNKTGSKKADPKVQTKSESKSNTADSVNRHFIFTRDERLFNEESNYKK